ncbi:MAG: NAD(P)/FAD-dependent oxidoreductase [Nitritalea sp.]
MPKPAHTYTVLIIGGGLAGLVSAILLRKAGHQVTLVEKKAYPFHRVCGEYISNEVRAFLKREALLPPDEVAEINRFLLSSTDGKQAALPLDLGGFGISRYALDLFLYQRALQEGVEVLEKEQALDVRKKGKQMQVMLQRGGWREVDLVLGAFGKRSRLDKTLQRDFMQREGNYIGVKYHVRSDFDPHTVALHNFPGGYCGMNKVEGDRYNLCYLGSQKDLKKYGSISEMEAACLYQNPLLKEIFENSTFLFEKPEVITSVSFAKKSPIEEDILMLGDAAGLITPLCGNGMAIAIHTAKLAAEAINESSSPEIARQRYAKSWYALFYGRLRIGRMIQTLFGAGTGSRIAVGLLRYSPTLSTQLMARTHGQPF